MALLDMSVMLTGDFFVGNPSSTFSQLVSPSIAHVCTETCYHLDDGPTPAFLMGHLINARRDVQRLFRTHAIERQ